MGVYLHRLVVSLVDICGRGGEGGVLIHAIVIVFKSNYRYVFTDNTARNVTSATGPASRAFKST